MGIDDYRVPAERLRWRCDPNSLDFSCTDELTPLEEFIGQDRAISAIKFGLEMDRPGFNIFVAGLTGTGKTSMVKSYIERLIKEQEQREGRYRADDWCYLYNFSDPDRPQITKLPQGKGKAFANQMATFLLKLREELTKIFSSDEYEAERKRLIDESQAQQRLIMEHLEAEARSRGFLFQMSPMGPLLLPVNKAGTPVSQQDYLSLSEKEKKALEDRRAQASKIVESSFEKVRELQMNAAEKVRQLDRQVGERMINRLYQEILADYSQFADLNQYLNELKTYTLDNLEALKQTEAPPSIPFGMPGLTPPGGGDPFLPFKVNVYVDNSETVGPPVIVETNPTYGNLFGKIERRFFLGGYLSDHTMLKAGSLARANGGYLLLNVRDVLMVHVVWLTLKRVIQDKEVRIEDPFEQFGLLAPMGMRPQPMPIQIKVILIGEDYLYQALSLYDEDFWEIFKVKADLDFEIHRDQENMHYYACFIASCCRSEGIRHFDASGVARVLEHAARMVADQEKLTSRFAYIKEWLLEADYWASQANSSVITAEHVQRAIDEKLYRHNLADEHMREMIGDGTLMIDVDGAVVGQVNGLSLYQLGDLIFGKPSRITAKTFMGRDGVINIERESQLSGSIHDKGVLILGGYVGWKYAQDKPLSLSASLCFEQSYQGVEGDSASSTELYAILSSLSEVPLKQGIAVTGSVNQMGEVQPIGGVNHKIEGFFQVCQAKGLTGEQGVLIPKKNLRHLMLRDEVVEAVSRGQFHIYAVDTVDEGIEVLTGLEVGERRSDGSYPERTINYLVDQKLRKMAAGLKAFYSEKE